MTEKSSGEDEMKTPGQQIITWTARILGIGIGGAFIALHFYEQITKGKYLSLGENIVIFLFFLLPYLIPSAVLFVAWRWEIAGGIIYLVVGGLGVFCVGLINLFTPEHPLPWMIMLITAPAFITGGLFIISGMMKRRKKMTIKVPISVNPTNLQNED
jgi:hypothetical protein